MWCPIIDIDSGKILNWKEGAIAKIHYKVCDQFNCQIKDGEGNVHKKIEDEYVPGSMCPEEDGYGDYIIMNVDSNGIIEDWNFDIDDFFNDNE